MHFDDNTIALFDYENGEWRDIPVLNGEEVQYVIHTDVMSRQTVMRFQSCNFGIFNAEKHTWFVKEGQTLFSRVKPRIISIP